MPRVYKQEEIVDAIIEKEQIRDFVNDTIDAVIKAKIQENSRQDSQNS